MLSDDEDEKTKRGFAFRITIQGYSNKERGCPKKSPLLHQEEEGSDVLDVCDFWNPSQPGY